MLRQNSSHNSSKHRHSSSLKKPDYRQALADVMSSYPNPSSATQDRQALSEEQTPLLNTRQQTTGQYASPPTPKKAMSIPLSPALQKAYQEAINEASLQAAYRSVLQHTAQQKQHRPTHASQPSALAYSMEDSRSFIPPAFQTSLSASSSLHDEWQGEMNTENAEIDDEFEPLYSFAHPDALIDSEETTQEKDVEFEFEWTPALEAQFTDPAFTAPTHLAAPGYTPRPAENSAVQAAYQALLAASAAVPKRTDADLANDSPADPPAENRTENRIAPPAIAPPTKDPRQATDSLQDAAASSTASMTCEHCNGQAAAQEAPFETPFQGPAPSGRVMGSKTLRENRQNTLPETLKTNQTKLANAAASEPSHEPPTETDTQKLPPVPEKLYRHIPKGFQNSSEFIENLFLQVPSNPIAEEIPPVKEQTAIRQTPSSPTHPILAETSPAPLGDLLDNLHYLPEMSDPWNLTKLMKPQVVASIIGLCVMASTIFAGLGYWWLNAESRAAQNEAYGLLNMSEQDDASSPEENSASPLQHLKQLEQNPIKVPAEEQQKPLMLLAQADSVTEKIRQELDTTGAEPTGRMDPFSPLVQTGAQTGSTLNPVDKKKDVLADVQFNGFVGDMNAPNKVAIIKMINPAGGTQTLIKKAGESFTVEGETVTLRAITKDCIHLKAQGEMRRLFLNPYSELVSANNPSHNGASGSTNSAADGNGNSGFSNINALSPNPANPTLQEATPPH